MTAASITVDEAVAAVQTLAGINWASVEAGLTSGNFITIDTTVGDIAGFISQFVPEASYVRDATELLAYVAAAREAGLWQPGQPEDPAEQHADGPTPSGMSGG